MTACVNKHSKRVALAISASLVGALSLGATPALAQEAGIDILADSTATDQNLWNDATIDWNVDADDFGQRDVVSGDTFSIESMVDVYGNEIGAGDYAVLYADSTGNFTTTNTVDGQIGGMPKTVADGYQAVVVKLPNTSLDSVSDGSVTKVSELSGIYRKVEFNVVDEKASLEGAYAYEVKTDENDTSDTSFTYNGKPLKIGFADSDGNPLAPSDYTVAWVNGDPTRPTSGVTDAGTYTAILYGDGTQEQVTVNVAKLDLSSADISIAMVSNEDGLNFDSVNGGILDQNSTKVLLDGDPIAAKVVNATFVSRVNDDGSVTTDGSALKGKRAKLGKYLFSIENAQGDDSNVTGSTTVTTYVVDQLANVEYDGAPASSLDGRVFETAEGEAFDPEELSATVGSDDVTLKWTVTKDGVEVTDYSQPGQYKVRLEVPVPGTCDYGFNATYTFSVVSKNIGDVTVYASVDGKSVTNGTTAVEFPYTGEAYVPTVVVKEGKKVLDPADYAVSYELDGKTVESMVEPDEYTIVVSFPGTSKKDVEIAFKVGKAGIKSFKAVKDVSASTGEAVKPDFIGYTGANLTGDAIELPNAGVGVSYVKALTDANGNPKKTDGSIDWTGATSVAASNLTEEGWYKATVTISSDNDHYKNSAAADAVKTCVFQISSYAAFSDVAADAWYADAVYNANELNYMNGISGTRLFMPMADITRAELAQVFYNMAGKPAQGDIFTPTKFDDVDPFAWYAEPIAWASEAGVVTGYDASTFAPSDKATREQVAVMLYRYAVAQGKDVSVEDADATLSAYKDADQVSDWAKEAMAWAVDNGIFGQGTDELWAKQNIQRCAVATIAVRFQPEALPEA